MQILFLHGLESGPHGSKYHALVNANHQVIAPDLRGCDLVGRVKMVTPFITSDIVVVGSSYGGITALLAIQASGVLPKGLVLCAPALARAPEVNLTIQTLPYIECPTYVIHGMLDDVCPLEHSAGYVARRQGGMPFCRMVLKASGNHRLDSALTDLVECVGKLL